MVAEEAHQILHRALVAGDRLATVHAAERIVSQLSVVDSPWYLSTHLGFLASGRADASQVARVVDLNAWADRVVEEVSKIRVPKTENDLVFATEIARARAKVQAKARHCRYLVKDLCDGEWNQPGDLVRAVCDLGEFHLAHQIAQLMCIHGDGSAGRNVRAAMIRGLATEEAVRLTAEIVRKNPNHYHYNTRTGCLMDHFMNTGDADVFSEATVCVKESLRLTPRDERRLSYTIATLSRVVRVASPDLGRRVNYLADCLKSLSCRQEPTCSPECQLDGNASCNCPKSLVDVWIDLRRTLLQAGLMELARIVRSRDEEMLKVAPVKSADSKAPLARRVHDSSSVLRHTADLSISPF